MDTPIQRTVWSWVFYLKSLLSTKIKCSVEKIYYNFFLWRIQRCKNPCCCHIVLFALGFGLLDLSETTFNAKRFSETSVSKNTYYSILSIKNAVDVTSKKWKTPDFYWVKKLELQFFFKICPWLLKLKVYMKWKLSLSYLKELLNRTHL